jgi:Domain of unknown function (DUF4276)
VKITIYVEGGGKNNPDVRTRCREGFSDYCNKLSPIGRLPQVVVCGSRNEAFKRFNTAVSNIKAGDRCALLVDAEGPVRPGDTPDAHLSVQDRWNFASLPRDRVFLMVQAMEAWFLADRSALVAYYGQGFRPTALPGDELNVEAIRKDDLVPSLVNASRGTAKGQYHKTRHGFALLARIAPSKVEAGSPHAAAFHRFLRST